MKTSTSSIKDIAEYIFYDLENHIRLEDQRINRLRAELDKTKEFFLEAQKQFLREYA